jgi:hypothetical protein
MAPSSELKGRSSAVGAAAAGQHRLRLDGEHGDGTGSEGECQQAAKMIFFGAFRVIAAAVPAANVRANTRVKRIATS